MPCQQPTQIEWNIKEIVSTQQVEMKDSARDLNPGLYLTVITGIYWAFRAISWQDSPPGLGRGHRRPSKALLGRGKREVTSERKSLAQHPMLILCRTVRGAYKVFFCSSTWVLRQRWCMNICSEESSQHVSLCLCLQVLLHDSLHPMDQPTRPSAHGIDLGKNWSW